MSRRGVGTDAPEPCTERMFSILTLALPRVDSQEMPQPRPRRWTVILAVATALGLFSSFQAYNVVRLFESKPQPFVLLLGLNFGYWYSWAVLAPIVLVVARRFPFERGSWARSVPVHLVAVLVLIFLHVVMSRAIAMQ